MLPTEHALCVNPANISRRVCSSPLHFFSTSPPSWPSPNNPPARASISKTHTPSWELALPSCLSSRLSRSSCFFFLPRVYYLHKLSRSVGHCCILSGRPGVFNFCCLCLLRGDERHLLRSASSRLSGGLPDSFVPLVLCATPSFPLIPSFMCFLSPILAAAVSFFLCVCQHYKVISCLTVFKGKVLNVTWVKSNVGL